MQVSISAEKLKTAPPLVVAWIADELFDVEEFIKSRTPEATEAETSEPEKPKKETGKGAGEGEGKGADTDVPPMSEVLAKAKTFMDSQGMDALQAILTKLEIPRVRECPPDKVASLLAEIAVS